MSKSMRLSFKGDPKKKKKKKSNADKDFDTYSGPTEGWTSADIFEDIQGPVMIVSGITEPPSVLCCSERDNKLYFKPLADPRMNLTNAEPDDVEQVFLATKLPTGGSKISLKSAFDRYISTDKFGVVSCETEAVGPTEEWEVVIRDDGIGLLSARSKYLSADESGAKGSQSALPRADSEEMKFKEVFKVRCQAQYKIKSRKRKAEESSVDANLLELEQIKKFHSHGKVILTDDDRYDLKKAKKAGALNEALLDRRAQMKSDKFCK
ncbi:hypothetical protein HDV05_003271 [Chytridiales sp. JEL 0842]|nr:hypothetical protein HDV05_003271 [Chytridiales sp. JEL 0842]